MGKKEPRIIYGCTLCFGGTAAAAAAAVFFLLFSSVFGNTATVSSV